MATTRRAFLATLAASMGLDADRLLLWVPGAKLVSIPQPQGFSVGDWVTIEGIGRWVPAESGLVWLPKIFSVVGSYQL